MVHTCVHTHRHLSKMILKKLHQRACAAYTAAQAGIVKQATSTSTSTAPDELQVLGGRKTVISNPSPSASPTSNANTAKNTSSVSHSPSVAAYQPLRDKSEKEFVKSFSDGDTSATQYYGQLDDPRLVLSTTKDVDPTFVDEGQARDSSTMRAEGAYHSGLSATEEYAMPPSFYGHYMYQGDTAVNPEQIPMTYPVVQHEGLGVDIAPPPHQMPLQSAQHQQHAQVGYVSTRPHNQEQIWRDFIHHLGLNRAN